SFFLLPPPPPSSPLFPYTTLFRSLLVVILISVFLAVERAIPQRQSVALPAKKTVESPPERHPEAPVSRPKVPARADTPVEAQSRDRKSTRLNSSHVSISYAVFCLK